MSTGTANYQELVEQSARLFENALKAGITVQQQSAKWFGETLRGMGASPWPSKGQAAIEQVMSAVQKQTDDTIRNMSDNAKSSMELLEKAFEIRQNGVAAESETRNREMWEAALNSPAQEQRRHGPRQHPAHRIVVQRRPRLLLRRDLLQAETEVVGALIAGNRCLCRRTVRGRQLGVAPRR